MASGDRLSTRGAVFHGDRLHEACRALRLKGSELAAAQVISPGTLTKLKRRYMGGPVEAITRDRLVDFLKVRTDIQSRARLADLHINLDEVLLPATFRLSDDACRLAARYRMQVRDDVYRRDRVDDRQIGQMLRGAYAVRKHVHPIAQQLFRLCTQDSIDLRGCQSPDGFIEEEPDHNRCFPTIYRRRDRARSHSLLPLLQAENDIRL